MPWYDLRPSWQQGSPSEEFAKSFQNARAATLLPLQVQQMQNQLKSEALNIANQSIRNQQEGLELDFQTRTMSDRVEDIRLKSEGAKAAWETQMEQKRGLAALAKMGQEHVKEIGTDNYSAAMASVAKEFPSVMLTKPWSDAQNLNEQTKAQREMAAALSGDETATLPEGTSYTWRDPKTGRTVSKRAVPKTQMDRWIEARDKALEDEDPETADIYQKLIDKRTNKPKTASEVTLDNLNKSQKELEAATSAFQTIPDTDPKKQAAQERVTKAKTDFEYWSNKSKGSSIDITTTTPEGTSQTVRVGGGGVSPSAGVGNLERGLTRSGLATKIEPKIGVYENAIELVKDLEQMIDSGDVGIAGNIAELKSRALGQFGEQFVEKKAMLVRSKINQLSEAVAREIPEGGRETEKQRQEVLLYLPSTGVWESAGRAKVALQAVRDLMMMRARNYAAKIGQVPLVSMTPQQMLADLNAEYSAIDARARSGIISTQEADQLKLKVRQEHIDAYNRFYPQSKTSP